MQINRERKISGIASVSFHLLLALIFLFIKVSGDQPAEEYLLVGFGTGSGMGSPFPAATEKNADEEKNISELKPEKNKDLKKIDLPKSARNDENNIISKTDRKNEKEEPADSKVKPIAKGEAKKGGSELAGEGEGGYGFELDFGGKGMRRIYSYNLPEYPEGVSKEIDLKLRFTILPDGTVSKIVPLLKADTKLEFAAINSLKQWRFQPLPSNAKQVEQTVVIIFPYRLR